ncbi:hypothetical protein FYC62_05065 [Pedobacter aquae]|uniref:Uncharacterized protein n=1 Tax=Pedobacter aquae TaxID=2605747 RepID=A0A5C0VEK5_9SPHI|nr:DUF6580 family putative transport protein [Pedobacter aquae]QEK51115.1 hypothetical protein FYC62_05065 [Pedobacter aquae]
MSLNKINVRNWVLVVMILAAAATRFFSLGEQTAWSNFTPVGAIAMFGGTYFTNKYKAYLVPLITLFISDIFVTYSYTGEFTLFYNGFIWVYICFVAMVFIGSLIKTVNVNTVLLGSLAGVLIHWLVTDIEPWLGGTLYNKDITGYYQSLIAAIPFEKNLLLGNLVFGAVLYGGFELAKSKFTILKSQKELAY